ncbi:unnamed protein product, partial [Effrenium voratum]
MTAGSSVLSECSELEVPNAAMSAKVDLAEVNTEGLYKMMMQHHKEVMDQLDCHSAILSALSARKVSVMTNYHSPDSASSSGQGPPPKSRRASFTPLQFVTFEEEERNRQAAALANSNMASGSASMTQPDVGFFKRLIQSQCFNLFFTAVVVTNAIFIGIEVQLSLDNSNRPPVGIQVVQYVYTGFFTVELALRVAGEGIGFFYKSNDLAWNWLDIFIVMTSLGELFMDLANALSNDSHDFLGIQGMSSLKAFRIIRMSRIAKTVRLIHMFRFVLALRMLIASILSTLKSLVSASQFGRWRKRPVPPASGAFSHPTFFWLGGFP